MAGNDKATVERIDRNIFFGFKLVYEIGFLDFKIKKENLEDIEVLDSFFECLCPDIFF